MKKSIIIFSLIIFVAIGILPVQKTNAAAPVVVRVVAGSAGERVLVGIAEKAGINYATKTARKKAVEKWNLDVYEKIKYYDEVGETYKAEELRRFQTTLSQVTPAQVQPLVTGNNMGSFLVNSAMFLTGADLLWDGYQSIKTAMNNDAMIERMKEEQRALEAGEKLVSYRGAKAILIPSGDVTRWAFGFYPDNYDTLASTTYASPDKPVYIDIVSVTYYSPNADTITYNYDSYKADGTLYQRYNQSEVFYHAFYTESFERVASKVMPEHLPNITDLPWVQPYRETGAVPAYAPQEVPVNIPLDDNYPEILETPWNEPDTFSEPETTPDPTKEPEPESVPEHSSWWKWLLNPLEKILQLLKELFEWLKGIFGKIPEWFSSILSYLADLLGSLGQWFSKLFEDLGIWFQKLWDWLGDILWAIVSLPELIWQSFVNFLVPPDPIGPMFDPITEEMKTKFNQPSDFAFLKPAFKEGACPPDILLDGQKIVDMKIPCSQAWFWKPIMGGFMWFLFGFWAFRKANQLMSKRGGVE